MNSRFGDNTPLVSSGGQTTFISSQNGVVHESNTVQRPDGTVSTQNFVNGVPVAPNSAPGSLNTRFSEDQPHHSGVGVTGGQTFVSSTNGVVQQTNSVQNADGTVSTQTFVNGKPVHGGSGHGLHSRIGENLPQAVSNGHTSVVSSQNGISTSSTSIQNSDGSVVTQNLVNGNYL